jgi:hypothetical protein
MLQVSYDKQITALLVIDPFNDFISEGGKVWDRHPLCARAVRIEDACSKVVDTACSDDRLEGSQDRLETRKLDRRVL